MNQVRDYVILLQDIYLTLEILLSLDHYLHELVTLLRVIELQIKDVSVSLPHLQLRQHQVS